MSELELKFKEAREKGIDDKDTVRSMLEEDLILTWTLRAGNRVN